MDNFYAKLILKTMKPITNADDLIVSLDTIEFQMPELLRLDFSKTKRYVRKNDDGTCEIELYGYEFDYDTYKMDYEKLGLEAWDFDADYFVLDARNGGSQIVMNLGKVIFDEHRKKEYSQLKSMNDSTYADLVKNPNAKECIYVINATQQLNSDMAYGFRRNLNEGKIKLLVNYNVAKEEILYENKDYINELDVERQIEFERPFLETQALINEAGELMYEKNPQTGTIKVFEKGTNTKDRYVACAMASHFIDLLEQDLISNSDEYEFATFIN